MNDQFSPNEDWECHQKSYMHFDIVKERNTAAPAGSGSKKGQEQHRQPGDPSNDQ